MGTPSNHWKLGLFVVVGAVAAVAMVGVLGALSLNPELGHYVSYFDESVQGLEVGSPIKFRGVTIGSVGRIDVAPDHRHVEVEVDLRKAALARLGLDVAAGPVARGSAKKLEQAIDLRAQLASSGVTGVKFLQLDFFAVADNPPPVLPFPVPHNYIPATSSMIKDLEDSLVDTMSALPEIAASAARILVRMDQLVSEANDMMQSMQLPAAVADLREMVTRINVLLADLEGEKGLIQSVQRASNSVNDAARTAGGVGGQLEDTLRSVDEAAQSLRKLTDAIEKEPDMLVKGRVAERQP